MPLTWKTRCDQQNNEELNLPSKMNIHRQNFLFIGPSPRTYFFFLITPRSSFTVSMYIWHFISNVTSRFKRNKVNTLLHDPILKIHEKNQKFYSTFLNYSPELSRLTKILLSYKLFCFIYLYLWLKMHLTSNFFPRNVSLTIFNAILEAHQIFLGNVLLTIRFSCSCG